MNGPKSRGHQKQSNSYCFYSMHFIRNGVLKFYPIFKLKVENPHIIFHYGTINQISLHYIN